MDRPAKEAAYHIIEVNSDMGGDIMMSPEILARMIERFVKSKGRKRGNPHPKKRTKSLLSNMAGKKWKAYKRKHPHGRKTYIQIRSEVSRSRAYKKRKP